MPSPIPSSDVRSPGDGSSPAVTLSRDPWRHDERFVASLRASWEDQYADYLGRDDARTLIRSLERRGTLYRHHDPSTLVATAAGHLVGVAASRPLGKLSLVTMLEVLPAYRGRGIGSRLLRALDSGSNALMAHVSVHRPRVKALYVAAGFAVLERMVVDHGGHPLELDVVAKAPGGDPRTPHAWLRAHAWSE